MSALDVLKEVAAVADTRTETALPAQIVRFSLEFESPPDLTAQRARLAALLQSERFSLQPLDADLPTFLVLQFPGVRRSISTPTLFAMAAEIARALDLVSCVPDVGVPLVVDPGATGSTTESVIGDALLNFTCWAKEDATLDKTWAVKSVRADRAWAKSKGRGIVIAQPDTGIASHPDLEQGMFDLAKATNILDGSNDPTDPLRDSAGNPGHGTATSSTLASRAAGSIVGTAPEAQVVPIRCVDSVILGLDGTPIARAVLHARRIGADIVSMSLGGPFYCPALSAAIAQAVESGMIVCAAAGNCVQPIVVYPASDENVIALAGVDIEDRPWKGTSRGAKVDVAGPAENVFVARRTPTDGGVGSITPSQGTSFATALTAGVAALWLGHFGRDNVRAEAHRRHLPVHHLFRAALRASARPPASGHWDQTRFGAGIVDAEALLNLPLADIPAPPPMPEAVATDDAETAVQTIMIEAVARRRDGFDWRRHGAEAVYLATDAWRRAHAATDMLSESARKPEPTPELAATAPAVLRTAIAQASDAPIMRPPVVGEAQRRSLIRGLAARGAGGVEALGVSEAEARQHLRGRGLDELQQLASQVFARLDAEGGSAEASSLRRSVLEGTAEVINGLTADAAFSPRPEQRMMLEALVQLKGRPALRVVDGTISPTDPLFGEWGGSLLPLPEIPAFTSAVGRIDGDGGHVGTGFLIGADLVMTNRHVLEAIAEEVKGPAGSKWIFAYNNVTIDFSDGADGSKRFQVKSVIACGPDPIENRVRFPHLDMALLQVETTNAAGQKLPPALPLIDETPDLHQKGDMFIIGFPARPSTSSMVDPATGQFSVEVSKRLAQIFNVRYGRKYLSPGIVDTPQGLVGDGRNWVFSHDATSLGGNSGSPAFRIMDPFGACGLHFGGATLTANYAHSLAAVKATGLIAALAKPDVNWLH
uniref:Peptidase S8 and S53, subtilisin, kexin, sedolisin n=1 Tax=Rhodopseudomonas palustris (strain BisA53) TaxID=316055 RepID=Q07HM2_RHOP5